MNIRRGDIYYADLSPVVGSEQGGIRPVLIVQNNVGNRFSPTVIAAAITSQQSKANLLPTFRCTLTAQDLPKTALFCLNRYEQSTKNGSKKKWVLLMKIL